MGKRNDGKVTKWGLKVKDKEANYFTFLATNQTKNFH